MFFFAKWPIAVGSGEGGGPSSGTAPKKCQCLSPSVVTTPLSVTQTASHTPLHVARQNFPVMLNYRNIVHLTKSLTNWLERDHLRGTTRNEKRPKQFRWHDGVRFTQ